MLLRLFQGHLCGSDLGASRLQLLQPLCGQRHAGRLVGLRRLHLPLQLSHLLPHLGLPRGTLFAPRQRLRHRYHQLGTLRALVLRLRAQLARLFLRRGAQRGELLLGAGQLALRLVRAPLCLGGPRKGRLDLHLQRRHAGALRRHSATGLPQLERGALRCRAGRGAPARRFLRRLKLGRNALQSALPASRRRLQQTHSVLQPRHAPLGLDGALFMPRCRLARLVEQLLCGVQALLRGLEFVPEPSGLRAGLLR
mmetsp:Transcript_17267/g.43851  ORF Transcript_17267/g.43851 Transcript_17267/m.43851 type:complete len:253 (-) Transcript_17267:2371-3129(-)